METAHAQDPSPAVRKKSGWFTPRGTIYQRTILQDLGATPAVGQGDVSWTVLADPEGNEFDVLTPR